MASEALAPVQQPVSLELDGLAPPERVARAKEYLLRVRAEMTERAQAGESGRVLTRGFARAARCSLRLGRPGALRRARAGGLAGALRLGLERLRAAPHRGEAGAPYSLWRHGVPARARRKIGGRGIPRSMRGALGGQGA